MARVHGEFDANGPSDPFPSGILRWHDDPDATVDICFVHGFTGSQSTAWTADGQDCPWPVSLLPSELNNCSLLSYGYDASGCGNEERSLTSHADDLLHRLTNNRAERSASSRPLIFVAHGTGGLVCKSAIFSSHSNPGSRLYDVFINIRGIIFLGTPHGGNWIDEWRRMPDPFAHQSSLLDTLHTNDDDIEVIQEQFLSVLGGLSNRPSLEIACFFESLHTPKMGLVVSAESATMKDFFQACIHASHGTMIQFASSNDPGFVSLLNVLKRWTTALGTLGVSTVHRNLFRGHGIQQNNGSIHVGGNLYITSNRMEKAVVGNESPITDSSPINTLRFGRNRGFVGRESLLGPLLEKIIPQNFPDACQITAVEGLGGIGKTQIALEASYRMRDLHPDTSIFWVPAISSQTFENAYREIGKQLRVPGLQDEKDDVKTLVKRALDADSERNWLFILDNADDVNLLFNDESGLSRYLPSNPLGSILVTTRSRLAVSRFGLSASEVFRAESMSAVESEQLLTNGLSGDQMSDTQSTKELLDFLAHLPLAIKQASAYMFQTSMSVSAYLRICQKSDRHFMDLLSKDFTDLSRDHIANNAVCTTWYISFEHLKSQSEAAAEMLQFLCFLSEKDIPRFVLAEAASDQSGAETDSDDSNSEVSYSNTHTELSPSTLEAIGYLKGYAFITERQEANAFDLHRLIRLAVRNWIRQQNLWDTWIAQSIARLAAIFPLPEYNNKHIWARLLPHTQTAIDHLSHCIDSKPALDLCHGIGIAYSRLGNFSQAQILGRRSLEVSEKLRGMENFKTRVIRRNLAIIMSEAGHLDAARGLLERNLGEYGDNDNEEMTNTSLLAEIHFRLGNYSATEELLTKVNQILVSAFGRDSPKTLKSTSDLAFVLGKHGDWVRAEPLLCEAFEGLAKVKGLEDQSTLNAMYQLGVALQRNGNLPAAEDILIQNIEIMDRVGDFDHPNSLLARSQLSSTLEELGRIEEAETMLSAVLDAQMRVLGKEHPDTLISQRDIAHMYASRGMVQKATEEVEKVLSVHRRTKGARNFHTLRTMGTLGEFYRKQGRYDESGAVLSESYEGLKEVLGLEHQNTLWSMQGLALVWWEQGKQNDAYELLRGCLDMRTCVHGSEHPDVLWTSGQLDDWDIELRGCSGPGTTFQGSEYQEKMISEQSRERNVEFTGSGSRLRNFMSRSRALAGKARHLFRG